MWSHLNWNLGEPKDMLAENWLEEYEQSIDALWVQIVRLNMLIYILEKINAFRFDLFADLQQSHFWFLVESAFFESAIMTLWRTVIDNSYADGLTLQQLKNDMFENQRIKTAADRQAFRKILKDIDFEKTLQNFRPTVEEIRHNYIGHFNLDKHLHPTTEDIAARKLVFSELVHLKDMTNLFFRALCFGHTKMVLPIAYDETVKHPVGSDSRTDIERILDSLAKQSVLLNLPEKQPLRWKHRRERLSEENMEVINRYRRKFGMPTV